MKRTLVVLILLFAAVTAIGFIGCFWEDDETEGACVVGVDISYWCYNNFTKSVCNDDDDSFYANQRCADVGFPVPCAHEEDGDNVWYQEGHTCD